MQANACQGPRPANMSAGLSNEDKTSTIYDSIWQSLGFNVHGNLDVLRHYCPDCIRLVLYVTV